MDTVEIEKLIKDNIDGWSDNSRKIYLLLMLAIWHEIFFESKEI